MKQFKNIILTAALALGLGVTVALPVAAQDNTSTNPGSNISDGVKSIGGKTGASGQEEFNNGIKNIVNTLLFILGIAAVIAIILGGFRYVTAQGDSGQVKTARDIILYACIGLVVAILAFAIVNFVITSFSSSTTK